MKQDDLDKQLQQLAKDDWNKFIEKVGVNSIVSAKVSLLREEGKSMGKIANALNLTRRQVKWLCTKN